MSITLVTKRGRILGHAFSYLIVSATSLLVAINNLYYPYSTVIVLSSVAFAVWFIDQVEKRYPKSEFFNRADLVAKARYKEMKEFNKTQAKNQLVFCVECLSKPGRNIVESVWCDGCYAEWEKYSK